MSENICISLRNVHKSFGAKEVLSSINLDVPCGAIYGMLGPSGCGKSTTVKIIAGILEASGGLTFVQGERMPSLEKMNEIGYMAQSDALYEELSARENLSFFGSLYGLAGMKLVERIKVVTEIVGLAKELDTTVKNYSGGMKRRLSLAMAILHRPKVLILDEPTVGIDPLLRKRIWQELYIMAEEDVSILVTTHVMDEAEKCTCLSMMRKGKIIATGTPNEIRREAGAENLEDAFLYFAGGAGTAGEEWTV